LLQLIESIENNLRYKKLLKMQHLLIE